ncbi:MAG TPA: tetratricopeptide repeat protein [Terracidiphilus sp.]|nr:tetratricopeptide repeat protein [Terracidiphilus sp.]
MRREFLIWLAAGCVWAGSQGLWAQAPANTTPAPQPSQQKPAQAPKPTASNPFPTDVNSVPLLPTSASALAAPASDVDNAHVRLPSSDLDPVASPDDVTSSDSGSASGFSSSTTGLDQLLQPPPDTGKKGNDSGVAPRPVETAKGDISVGNYYMSTHNWKGALSRFQSALVLAPDNPEVFWGLAECQRHLGQFAQARGNYLKVMEYDPDSKHSKDARKYLRQPELANAKPAPTGASAQR